MIKDIIAHQWFKNTIFWYGLIAALVIVQLLLLRNFGTNDMYSFIQLVETIEEYGLQQAYHVYNLNYPPLSSVLMYPITLLGDYRTFDQTTKIVLIKTMLAVFYFGFSGVIIWLYKQRTRPSSIQLAKKSFFILCNVGLFEATFILSYFDIFLALPLFGAVYAVHKNRFFLAGVCVASTFMIKLIGLFVVPVFIVYCVTLQKKSINIQWKSLLFFLAGMATVVAPLIYFFSYEQVNFIMTQSSAHGNQLSFAFNFPRIIQYIQDSNATSVLIHNISRASFLGISVLILWQVLRNPKTVSALLWACITILFTYFIMFTGVHENHLLPALMLALILYIWEPNRLNRLAYYGLTVIVLLNLLVRYGFGEPYRLNPEVIQSSAYTVPVAGLSIIICGWYGWLIWQYFKQPSKDRRIGSRLW